MKRQIHFLLGLALLLGGQPTLAGASKIFVYGSDPSVFWWLRKAVIRPMEKSVYGVDLESLNLLVQPANGEKICYADEIDRSSFAGISRTNQQEIQKTWDDAKFNPFEVFDVKTSFSSKIYIFESCESKETGYGVAVFDLNRQLKYAENFVIENKEHESVLRYIYNSDDGILNMSSCFMCGDISTLHYDDRRKKFYWEYNGD